MNKILIKLMKMYMGPRTLQEIYPATAGRPSFFFGYGRKTLKINWRNNRNC